MREMLADEVEQLFLDEALTFIGFSAENALFRNSANEVLVVAVCEDCGFHIQFFLAGDEDIEPGPGLI